MKYFNQQIQIAQMFGHKLAMPNAQNVRTWIDQIENELSPENLSCDGELRGSALRMKRQMLDEALTYCRGIQGQTETHEFSAGMGFSKAYVTAQAAYRDARQTRTHNRMVKLSDAVKKGFLVGAAVVLSNGVRGHIVKINRTRVRVKAEDARLWSVPPHCMSLLK